MSVSWMNLTLQFSFFLGGLDYDEWWTSDFEHNSDLEYGCQYRGLRYVGFENTFGNVGFREYVTPSLVGFTIP